MSSTSAAAAPDLSTFAKVRALHDSTTHPGERASAAVKMQTLARAAGMTVAQASASLDAPAPSPPRNPFEELFNSPEFRARQAERTRKYAERRAAALVEYGSEEAVWAPCDQQRALEEACRPVIVRTPIIGGEMDTLQGWDGGRWTAMPEPIRRAVAGAYVPPATVRETRAEYDYWEKRVDDQVAFCPDMDAPLLIRARLAYLEHRLDTLPATSFLDVRARLAWMVHLNEREWDRGNPEDRTVLDQLAADVERLGELIRASRRGAP